MIGAILFFPRLVIATGAVAVVICAWPLLFWLGRSTDDQA